MSETPTAGGDSSPNGSGWLPQGLEGAGTGASETNYQQILDGAQERSAAATAKHLAERRAAKDFGQVETAQSVDLEASLQEAQQHLHQLRQQNAPYQQIAKAEQQAYAIAESLVTGASAGTPKGYESSVDQSDDGFDAGGDRGQEIVDDIRNQYDWDTNVAYAAENMPEATVLGLNSVLESGDEVAITAAAKMLNNYRENQGAGFTTGEFNSLKDSDASMRELSERYSPEVAERIQVLGWAVASGKTSFGEALKLASKDQTLLTSLLDAQQRGIIDIYLGN